MTVDAVRARAYRIPTATPEADGTLAWDNTTLVVVTVDAGDATGLGWTYTDASAATLINSTLAKVVVGRSLDVRACWHAMQRAVRNIGLSGLVATAISAVDIALWDAAARILDVPVASLLGRVHDEVALYGSGGFTTYDRQQAQEQLTHWVHDQKIPRVKIKIGESWGKNVGRDLERVNEARTAIGANTDLYVDANGGYGAGLARRVARELEQLDVRWFEEPVSSDDLAGLAELRAATTIDIAAGEYGYDLPYFHRMLSAQAVDCLQIDATRCGGYTEWQRIAALAAATNRDVSAHCAPNLSAHIAASTPNFRHIEWFADHDRIESRLFDDTFDPAGGQVAPDLTAAGHGFTFKEADAETYAVR
ncbi:enolase C-terminal domain-like protein [Fodinicola acaciae]|uniref:enolase C-terminal domain-like protein n=1 Tax=Fodinicola acaciae TaxID=2681555 RepID=UPI0013D639BC|nr:enolase C-terminal domain-like protein [Fodinicola acaciae]